MSELSTTYYDLPVVKAAPWKWYIPAYFYVGGLAGASSTLGGAVSLLGRHELAPLARDLRWISAIGEAVGAGLLVADLGMPSRFHHMLRVRPTSPMSVGTWILSAAATASGLGVLRELLGKPPSPALEATAAVAGSMLATYTGVLVGNTALPAWHATREQLPLLFAASSASSAASLLELRGARNRREARVVKTFSIGAKVAELAATYAVERAAGEGVVGKPLREGRSGLLWRGAKWLQGASLAATLLPGQSRIAGALGTASAVMMRFAVVEIGHATARDPRATFEPQRVLASAR
jgi:formate-dependent nitrite reductase membrane component NrfD